LNLNKLRRRGMLPVALLVVLLLLGCTGDLAGILGGSTALPGTPTDAVLSTGTAGEPTAGVGSTPEAGQGPTATGADGTAAPEETTPPRLMIWLPPQFNPDGGSPAGDLLRQRLDQFAATHQGVEVQVRIKALSGPGGLLETLSTTSAAAPEALPALIALPRADLETAALKGLITPLDGMTLLRDDPDWYPYAVQLATLQDSIFGIPFGGEALMLMYRPARVGSPPTSWDNLLGLGQPVIFPAGDTYAYTTLALYQSTGAVLQDAQLRPTLELEAVEDVLSLYSAGARQGTFPSWLNQYQTDAQAWQAFREARGNLLIGWSSRYLAELPVDTAAAPLPPVGEQPYASAGGWLWAVSDHHTERHALAVELAEYLTEAEFMAEWTAAAGYMPPRISALDAWQNVSLKNMLDRISLSAQVRPTNDLVSSLGPVLYDASTQVLRNNADPAEQALEAIRRIGP